MRGGAGGVDNGSPLCCRGTGLFLSRKAHRMNDVEDSVDFCLLFPVLVVVHSAGNLETPRCESTARAKDECGFDRTRSRVVDDDWHMGQLGRTTTRAPRIGWSCGFLWASHSFLCTAKALTAKALSTTRSGIAFGASEHSPCWRELPRCSSSTASEHQLKQQTPVDQLRWMNLTFSVSARTETVAFLRYRFLANDLNPFSVSQTTSANPPEDRRPGIVTAAGSRPPTTHLRRPALSPLSPLFPSRVYEFTRRRNFCLHRYHACEGSTTQP